MMLILGLMCCLKTKQVDYTNAFAQADLPEPPYLELPERFQKELGRDFKDPKIELQKPGELAAKRWFHKLKTGLEVRGIRQSLLDPCLFMRRDMIIVTYVDDCIHWYRDDSVMEAFIQSIKDVGDENKWEHTVEGHVKNPQGNRNAGLQWNANTLRIRCQPLGSDADGIPAKEARSYPSVVGMLLYLQEIHVLTLHSLCINLEDLLTLQSCLMNSDLSVFEGNPRRRFDSPAEQRVEG